MSNVFVYAPNTVKAQASPGGTSWVLVASDGSTYSSLANLLAAGKTPFPGLDPGLFLQSLTLRSIATSGTADGSPFYFALNPQTTPAANSDGVLVSGSGQEFSLAGQKVWQLWVKATVGTDIIEALGKY